MRLAWHLYNQRRPLKGRTKPVSSRTRLPFDSGFDLMSIAIQIPAPSADSSLAFDKPNLGDTLIASLKDEIQSRAKQYLIRATGDSADEAEVAASQIAAAVIAEAAEAEITFSGWNQLVEVALQRVVKESVLRRSTEGLLFDVVPQTRHEPMRPAIAIRAISPVSLVSSAAALSRFALRRPKVSSVNGRG